MQGTFDIFIPRPDGLFVLLAEFLTTGDLLSLALTGNKFSTACNPNYVYYLMPKSIKIVPKFKKLKSLDLWGG